MSPTEPGHRTLQPSIKRQGSMKNLKGSDDGRLEDDSETFESSDCDKLFAESRYKSKDLDQKY